MLFSITGEVEVNEEKKELQDILLVNPAVLSLVGRMINSGDGRTATLERLAKFFPHDVFLIKNVSMEKLK